MEIFCSGGRCWVADGELFAESDEHGRWVPGGWRIASLPVELSDDLGARVDRARAALHGEETPEVVQRAAEVRRRLHGQQEDADVALRLRAARTALYGEGRR